MNYGMMVKCIETKTQNGYLKSDSYVIIIKECKIRNGDNYMITS